MVNLDFRGIQGMLKAKHKAKASGGVDINWRAEEAKILARHDTFKIMETSLNDSQLTQKRPEAEKLVVEAGADFKAFLEGL